MMENTVLEDQKGRSVMYFLSENSNSYDVSVALVEVKLDSLLVDRFVATGGD